MGVRKLCVAFVSDLIERRQSDAPTRDLPKYVYPKGRKGYLYFVRGKVCQRMHGEPGSDEFEAQYRQLVGPPPRARSIIKPPRFLPLPSKRDLLQLLRYDPAAGTVYRRRNGKRADRPTGDGRYRCIRIGQKSFLAHRVIWKMCHGEDPSIIDHINGDGHDNRLENLRSVTDHINQRNRSTVPISDSGVTGVTQWKDGRWRVSAGGLYLGTFEDFSFAVAVRREAERQLGYTERHGSMSENRSAAPSCGS